MLQHFFAEGGFAMFFLLAFGLATLVAASAYAFRVTRVARRLCLGLGSATVFATLAAVCVDLSTVGHFAPDYVRRHPDVTLARAVLQGIAESLAPAVLGFTLLAVSALLVTLGAYREPGE